MTGTDENLDRLHDAYCELSKIMADGPGTEDISSEILGIVRSAMYSINLAHYELTGYYLGA